MPRIRGEQNLLRMIGHFLPPVSFRSPSDQKDKLPWQLSPGPGRLSMDSLPGALLFLSPGDAARPQGGATALPERWAQALGAGELSHSQSPCLAVLLTL